MSNFDSIKTLLSTAHREVSEFEDWRRRVTMCARWAEDAAMDQEVTLPHKKNGHDLLKQLFDAVFDRPAGRLEGSDNIVINIKSGVVTPGILPEHTTVTVRDYDVDGVDEEELSVDEDGNKYLVTVF